MKNLNIILLKKKGQKTLYFENRKDAEKKNEENGGNWEIVEVELIRSSTKENTPMTELGNTIIETLGNLLNEDEPNFSDRMIDDLVSETNLPMRSIRGALSKLYRMGYAYSDIRKTSEVGVESPYADVTFLHLTDEGWEYFKELTTPKKDKEEATSEAEE